MKKVILTLSVIGFMTACSSSTTTEEVKTDSTAVAVDTVNVPTMDTVKAATVETSTTTPTTK